MKTLLVTGSSGLIGSEVCVHFAERGWQVQGVDNNQRAVFFGPQAIPFDDFDTNAVGTLNLLEATRRAVRRVRLCTSPPTRCMATGPTASPSKRWRPVGTMPILIK
jgi:nucleoside-diphosphate-sugar epimerase